MPANPLRNLPSINEILESPVLKHFVGGISRNVVVTTVRTVLDEVRGEVQTAATGRTMPNVTELADRIAKRLVESDMPPLRPVINATGNVLRDDLGGPPLANEAVEEMVAVAREYASLDIALDSGKPVREAVAVEQLLQQVTGAEAALVTNDHPAASLLTLAAMVGTRHVVVARGQLVELRRGCRVADLIAASGATLREVGAINAVRLDDYQQAVDEQTGAIVLVYPDRCAVVGDMASVKLADLVGLAHQADVPLICDLPGATLIDLACMGVHGAPLVTDYLRAGAGVVVIRGDGLVGGPTCGIILGSRDAIERIERHPLAAVCRASKTTLAALAATLRLYGNAEEARRAVPVLHLLGTSVDNLKNRAERLAPQLAASKVVEAAEPSPGTTYLTPEALPSQRLETWRILLRPANASCQRLATSLRNGSPALVARVEDEHVVIDLRSVLAWQDTPMVAAFDVLGSTSGTLDS